MPVLLSLCPCLQFVRIIPGILPLLLLTVFFLAFFAFCGLTLFHGIPHSSDYFGSFGQSMWNLLVLQTSSNFPDVRLLVLCPPGHACNTTTCESHYGMPAT